MLAAALDDLLAGTGERPLVLGVARGGVPVAKEIADVLEADLDVAMARKIGAPRNPEFAIGAMAAGAAPVLDDAVISRHRIAAEYVAAAVAREGAELERRTREYRRGRSPIEARGRLVIVADDGVATGSTLKAVLAAVRSREPRRLVCAVPVGPPATIVELDRYADDVVCPLQPRGFTAVGGWYDDFSQLGDDVVVSLLEGQ